MLPRAVGIGGPAVALLAAQADGAHDPRGVADGRHRRLVVSRDQGAAHVVVFGKRGRRVRHVAHEVEGEVSLVEPA